MYKFLFSVHVCVYVYVPFYRYAFLHHDLIVAMINMMKRSACFEGSRAIYNQYTAPIR